jgi:hypothetical protein
MLAHRAGSLAVIASVSEAIQTSRFVALLLAMTPAA